jgi:hypothetical protein
MPEHAVPVIQTLGRHVFLTLRDGFECVAETRRRSLGPGR